MANSYSARSGMSTEKYHKREVEGIECGDSSPLFIDLDKEKL